LVRVKEYAPARSPKFFDGIGRFMGVDTGQTECEQRVVGLDAEIGGMQASWS
jgi:hypothetical protein